MKLNKDDVSKLNKHLHASRIRGRHVFVKVSFAMRYALAAGFVTMEQLVAMDGYEIMCLYDRVQDGEPIAPNASPD